MKYFVTTVGFYSKLHKKYKHMEGESHTRCVGYFDTFEEAEEAVLENHGDIYECGYYTYAVVEAMRSGLYPHVFNLKWYKADWVESNQEYPLGRYDVTKVDTPDFAECITGWAIG